MLVLSALLKSEAESLRNVTITEVMEGVISTCTTRHSWFDENEWLELKKIERRLDESSRLRHLVAAVNVQHWPHPNQVDPDDPFSVKDWYYWQSHAAWRCWVFQHANRGEAPCAILSAFELRSLMARNFSQLMNEWVRTCYASVVTVIFRVVCESCLIPRELVSEMLASHAAKHNDAVLMNENAAHSTLSCEFGLGFITRDRGGAAEEQAGIIDFRCITNDRTPQATCHLLSLKSIFSRQLPRMPREYITRLTLDRQHYSMCLLKGNKVIGGVCFRPFIESKFVEIVFLAIMSTEQVKGYGTRLMNHLKEYLRHRNMEFCLTYADNFALGYFRKQGFSTTITAPRERYQTYIKDYDGGTLMELLINPNINYLNVVDNYIRQKRAVQRSMRLIHIPKVYSGRLLWENFTPSIPTPTAGNPPPTAGMSLTSFEAAQAPPPSLTENQNNENNENNDDARGGPYVDPTTVPGFMENGWAVFSKNLQEKNSLPLGDQIIKMLDQLLKHEASWPFHRPVSRNEAPDYEEHIKQPMDISTMKKNAASGIYKKKDQFAVHLKKMFDNCRYYNQAHSIYYKLANDLEAAAGPMFEELVDD